MITMTELLNKIKRKLGVIYWNLPFPDSDLIEIIEDSINTFSRYYPRKHDVILDLQYHCIDPKQKKYRIDVGQLPKGTELISVNKTKFNDMYSNFMANEMGTFYSYGSIEDMIAGAANQNLVNAEGRCVPTMSFQAPDEIQFFNFYITGVKTLALECFITHPKNLSTIPMGAEDVLKKLALYDVKIFLYDNLRHYDKIETAYGIIDLKIDDWASAEQERSEYVEEKLANTKINSPQFDKVYFI